jgi:LAO/AO transport system kinase
VLVETVGVGQSETEIALTADTVVFCVQPGSGDSLQYMKAGIAEIPDIVAVTKSDLGSAAIRAKADVKGALSLSSSEPAAWLPQILLLSAQTGDHLDRLAQAIYDHWAWLSADNRLAHRRSAQAAAWLELAVKERWGRDGLRKVQLERRNDDPGTPFHRFADILRARQGGGAS